MVLLTYLLRVEVHFRDGGGGAPAAGAEGKPLSPCRSAAGARVEGWLGDARARVEGWLAALRWAVQQGVPVVVEPPDGDEGDGAYLQPLFNFSLTPSEMAALRRLDRAIKLFDKR